MLCLFLDFLQYGYLGSLSRIWLQLCWLVFRVTKPFTVPVTPGLFCCFLTFVAFYCVLIISRILQGRCALALVFRLGMLLSTNEVRFLLNKFQSSLMYLEFGFKYVVVR